MSTSNRPAANERLRRRLHTIIFEADTPAGKAFDIGLIIAILVSLLVVMLESIKPLELRFGAWFRGVEWVLTGLFTVEYLLRLYCVRNPWRYARSFYGVVDLLSILPTYLSLLVEGTHLLLAVRVLRLLRLFRVFKLASLLREAHLLMRALRASRGKIMVFLVFVVLMVIVIGAIMYVIEGDTNPGFQNIPVSIYWAVVTLTTVGFGDITPQTYLGRFFSAIVMILGYAVIAVPTGVVTMEIMRHQPINTQSCPSCSAEGHDDDARYCKYCGSALEEEG
ncbi:MAG: ion transporter [Saprospiraceae bacterium]|nr:ion transporter [Saprospiraceae bacterium]MDW8228873.1 ion transporter [Saprospiraceae bacterium]